MKLNRKTFTQYKTTVIGVICSVMSTLGLAGEIEREIVNKTVQAYGGKALLELKNLKYSDKLHHYFSMQSGHQMQGAMTSHLNEYQLETKIDFETKQSEFKQLSARLVGNYGIDNVTAVHRLFLGETGYLIDHCADTYQIANKVNFHNTDLGYSQMLDTLIARQLMEDLDQIKWLDTADIQGQPHHVLEVHSGQKNAFKVYLNRHTGYISRMVQKRGPALRHYDFLEHQNKQGLVWAKKMYVSSGTSPLYYTDSRNLSANLEELSFQLPANLTAKKPKTPVDVSKLTINKLAEGVYLIGQDWGYSLFVDVGEYYISVGAWHFENLAKPYQNSVALLKHTTGTNKPIKQHIVTHHHTDHMAGLAGIMKSGTNLVIHNVDIPAVSAHLKQTANMDLTKDRIVAIAFDSDHTSYLAKGKVMLFDLPTSHSSHNLMLYLPEHGILFSEDIFGSGYEDALDDPSAWPVLDTYQRVKKLDAKIKQLGIEVTQYASSHHKRVLNQYDINQALTVSCPSGAQLRQVLFND